MSKFRAAEAICVLLTLIIIVTIVFQGLDILYIKAAKNMVKEPITQSAYEISTKRDMLALLMAYPEHIKGFEKENDNTVYVIMQSGKKILYDDKKEKSYEGKLAGADIQDMMEQVYPLSNSNTLMQDNFDPGRIRNYAFLKEVYGTTRKETERNLTNVSLGSKNCSFNKQNNAAAALKTAFQEINGLLKTNPNIYSFVFPVNGTYNYRVISGTNQLSPHAFGITIDLKSNKYDYWKWATKEQGQSRLNAYPSELVRIFENNGFIWGGKWAHFDILHYEYRPELIIKSKHFINPNNSRMVDTWFSGFPDTSSVKSYVSLIESAFG